MTTVISVENLSKAYLLGQIGTGTFTNDLKVWLAKAQGKSNPLLKIGETDHGNRDGETVWALKNVSFEVEQGEVLGIIGRNGAGKSTLLKILSRITAPTSGLAKVKGRVASLLEVGTGFHPELTGRENIYLNGTILGMSKDDVRKKFDEIVDFSGIETFIDTPVKRYSSGMYVRLAFAVAAHLDPEILVVDEVLAVGDFAFQKKCLGKMGDVAGKGRTILFVSHNLGAILALCQRCVYLSTGKVSDIGETKDVISMYTSESSEKEQNSVRETNRNIASSIRINNAFLESLEQKQNGQTKAVFRISCSSDKTVPFNVEWHLTSSLDQRLAFGSPQHFRNEVLETKMGTFDLILEISGLPLSEGRYFLDIRLTNRILQQYYDILDKAVFFDILSYDPYKIGWSYAPKPGSEYGPFSFSDKVYIEPAQTFVNSSII